MTTSDRLQHKRVLITGAARGIGAALAKRLAERGARVAVAGLEPELLETVAREIDGPWRQVDVADRTQVDAVTSELVGELGGLDIVVANAGIARQLPIVGGDPEVMERTLAVNTLGTYYTLRAAAPHVAHPGGYLLATSSLAAAVHAPLMGAYSASKAAVEAIGNTLRWELHGTGARVGVAYYAELDTDMTSRGFGTRAGSALLGGRTSVTVVTPLSAAINALDRGIARRSRMIWAPWWIAPLLPGRMIAQRIAELKPMPDLQRALQLARDEETDFTTAQPNSPAKEDV
ncbi:SDR family NAD(P)-dependent oxidoreductase [Flexivirga caeni]|uniref:SDR family NAD(P)-dependent oxidoreductase n=1 Tax=Flexivirga caeni TaxID=2294115 RepID=A0A3M9M756_9MICO|nr:SDR family NAD(P)-dependent oxidoreductase [Flexivirga caeni]RNI21414.1 SDR family NAD(P)-dependent oxidoreductase [Flexivirga caeni]